MSSGERYGAIREFVRQSNRIESILRPPTPREIDTLYTFLDFSSLAVGTVTGYVAVVAGGKLRSEPGMDVIVGRHVPPPGSPDVERQLELLLNDINQGVITPWAAHVAYETLHPFTDGNGRSGRAIWAWQMERDGLYPFRLGFLHTAYYQALDAARP